MIKRGKKFIRYFIRQQGNRKTDSIRGELYYHKVNSETLMNTVYERLVKKREQYHSAYAYRGFSLTTKDNAEYDQLLDTLSSDKLNEFTEKLMSRQSKLFIILKQTLFIKFRDAIKEVMQQKDDLNRILAILTSVRINTDDHHIEK